MENTLENPLNNRELRVIIGQKTEDFTIMLETWGKQYEVIIPHVTPAKDNTRTYYQKNRK